MNAVTALSQVQDHHPLAESARCRFRLLQPGLDGVGRYHINTHIAFFRVPPNRTPAQLTRLLFTQFPSFFNPNPIATVAHSNCIFQQNPTMKFTAKIPMGPDVHDDWVAVDWQQSNFIARTLKRNWYTRREQVARAATSAGRVLGPAGLIPTTLGRTGIDVNRLHFLAGRRSWHVGLLRDPQLLFLETAAFERFSHTAFMAASPIIGIPDQILETWTKLLENFGIRLGLQPVSYRPRGYSINRQVAYLRKGHRNPVMLRSTPWFSAILPRHRGL